MACTLGLRSLPSGRNVVASASGVQAPQVASTSGQWSRRDAISAALIASVSAAAAPAKAVVQGLEVGDGLVQYVPGPSKTPSIRAGVIREPFYSITVPRDWKEAKIANILSGNFCMPGCAEPWTEVVFESAEGGRAQLLVAPLVKLTNKVNAPVTDLGTPETLLPRIGVYLTGGGESPPCLYICKQPSWVKQLLRYRGGVGTFLEEEDLVELSSKQQSDGLTYYYYELYAPAANGHSLTAVTTKGEGLYMFVCSASDKGWKAAAPTLRKMVEAFRV